MATLLIKQIPEKVMTAYKVYCAKEGVTQRADIIAYMKYKRGKHGRARLGKNK